MFHPKRIQVGRDAWVEPNTDILSEFETRGASWFKIGARAISTITNTSERPAETDMLAALVAAYVAIRGMHHSLPSMENGTLVPHVKSFAANMDTAGVIRTTCPANPNVEITSRGWIIGFNGNRPIATLHFTQLHSALRRYGFTFQDQSAEQILLNSAFYPDFRTRSDAVPGAALVAHPSTPYVMDSILREINQSRTPNWFDPSVPAASVSAAPAASSHFPVSSAPPTTAAFATPSTTAAASAVSSRFPVPAPSASTAAPMVSEEELRTNPMYAGLSEGHLNRLRQPPPPHLAATLEKYKASTTPPAPSASAAPSRFPVPAAVPAVPSASVPLVSEKELLTDPVYTGLSEGHLERLRYPTFQYAASLEKDRTPVAAASASAAADFDESRIPDRFGSSPVLADIPAASPALPDMPAASPALPDMPAAAHHADPSASAAVPAVPSASAFKIHPRPGRLPPFTILEPLPKLDIMGIIRSDKRLIQELKEHPEHLERYETKIVPCPVDWRARLGSRSLTLALQRDVKVGIGHTVRANLDLLKDFCANRMRWYDPGAGAIMKIIEGGDKCQDEEIAMVAVLFASAIFPVTHDGFDMTRQLVIQGVSKKSPIAGPSVTIPHPLAENVEVVETPFALKAYGSDGMVIGVLGIDDFLKCVQENPQAGNTFRTVMMSPKFRPMFWGVGNADIMRDAMQKRRTVSSSSLHDHNASLGPWLKTERPENMSAVRAMQGWDVCIAHEKMTIKSKWEPNLGGPMVPVTVDLPRNSLVGVLTSDARKLIMRIAHAVEIQPNSTGCTFYAPQQAPASKIANLVRDVKNDWIVAAAGKRQGLYRYVAAHIDQFEEKFYGKFYGGTEGPERQSLKDHRGPYFQFFSRIFQYLAIPAYVQDADRGDIPTFNFDAIDEINSDTLCGFVRTIASKMRTDYEADYERPFKLETLTVSILRNMVAGFPFYGEERRDTRFFVVAGVDALRIKNSKYTDYSVSMVASQFNFCEAPAADYPSTLENLIYDRTQGPRASLAFPLAASLRLDQFSATADAEIQPSVLRPADVLSNGYLWGPAFDDAEPREAQLKHWRDGNVGGTNEINYLAQTSYLHRNDPNEEQPFATQVFCAAVCYQGAIYKPEYDDFAKFPIERSYEFCFLLTRLLRLSQCRTINLHLTLLGAGAFGNPLKHVTESIAKYAPLLEGLGCNVFIHAFRREEAATVHRNLEKSLKGLASMTSDEFFAKA